MNEDTYSSAGINNMLELPLKGRFSTEAIEMHSLCLSLTHAHTHIPTHIPTHTHTPLKEGGVLSYYQIKYKKQDQTKLPPHFRPHI